jgi:hypothetical protein
MKKTLEGNIEVVFIINEKSQREKKQCLHLTPIAIDRFVLRPNNAQYWNQASTIVVNLL